MTDFAQQPLGKSAYSFDEVYATITRAANTTAYTANYIVNSDAATTLPEVNFGGESGQKVLINAVKLTSTQAPATSVIQPQVELFNVSSFSAQSVADNTSFTSLTATETRNKLKKFLYADFGLVYNWLNTGTGYEYVIENINKIIKLDSNGKAYLALLATNAYTPKSGEVIKIHFEGYLL